MSDPFIAQVTMFGGNFAPRAWAFCAGQLLPISQNTALFSLIGTTYGGDGRTTMALPDLRGRAPIQQGRGPGLSTYRLGQRGGAENTVMTSATMPNHSHAMTTSINVVDDNANSGEPAGRVFANAVGGGAKPYATEATDENMAPGALTTTLNTAGSGASYTNMQPFQTANYIIALQGVFPSRN
ncbi:MAG: tail fiber protein [Hellea sp.]